MPWVTSTPRTKTSGTISPSGCASAGGSEVVEIAMSVAVVVVVVVVVVGVTMTGDVVVVVVVVSWSG